MPKKNRREQVEEHMSEVSEATDTSASAAESASSSDAEISESESASESVEAEPQHKAKHGKSNGAKGKAVVAKEVAKKKPKAPKAEHYDDEGEITTELVEEYRRKARRYIRTDNMFGFVKVLSESPLATVLQNLHYIFVMAANNDEMIQELTRVNKDFNIVSKKFIRAVRESENCRHKFVESEKVSELIQNNTPLRLIPGISEYTPEFIIMNTIQSGDLVTCNLMLQKWEVAPMFAASKPLIAAFYGWEDFFGKTEKVKKTQDLIVHALCGGYKRVFRSVCSGSGAKWIIPETLEKACLVCPVRSDMSVRFEKMMGK